MDVLKVLNTVRYMTPRQWKYRLYYMVRDKLKNRMPKLPHQAIKSVPLPALYSTEIGNKDTTVADEILRDKIPTVSGKIVAFDGDWDLTNEDYRLVCFKLNSFRWLLYLSDAYKATGERKYIDKGLELIMDWQAKCGYQIRGDKWNAYVIAERITNWIGFCSEYATGDIEKYARIIYPQAQELKDSLEYQLGANHLLSEAKALVYAGVFLEDDDLYRSGRDLLVAEAKEQFYPDGGHYEQSVSYHVESLQQCFETYAIMKVIDDSNAEILAEIMNKPYQFLNGMISVNGNIPLFNDSAYDYPFYDAADFLATASYIFSSAPTKGKKGSYYNRWGWLGIREGKIEWKDKIKYDNTGFIHYQFERAGRKYSFFMDCGNNGPDYNLGHTHADALSVLLYSEDKDILVDSGVFTYKPGIERNACRSTKAHNTVEIDGQNNAEIWSAFRVAKRGHTKVSEFSSSDGLKIKASHDGYEKVLNSPVEHVREVIVRDGKIEINDILNGNDEHKAVSRYHIGSECRVERINAKSCRIDGNITIKSNKDISITNCSIATCFGVIKKSKCLEIAFQDKVQTIFEIG